MLVHRVGEPIISGFGNIIPLLSMMSLELKHREYSKEVTEGKVKYLDHFRVGRISSIPMKPLSIRRAGRRK